VLVLLAWPPSAAALGSQQNPQSGSQGVQGTVTGPAPQTAPTITTPSNGQVFTSIPITVSGLCQSGLLVKVFSNNVFVGSVMCVNGSFSLKIDLFSKRNDLTSRQFDALDQASPVSNTVAVTFNDTQFTQFGTVVSLNSDYAKRGANPGATLTWPIILTGGVGPYAISIDWGDGTTPDLISQQFPGTINVKHVYSNAGTYDILMRATDKNGTRAYLQVVGVANGNATQQPGGASTKNGKTITKVLWWPSVGSIAICVATFWLGRRYELASLRKRIETSSRS
jgi:hypothetical protein